MCMIFMDGPHFLSHGRIYNCFIRCKTSFYPRSVLAFEFRRCLCLSVFVSMCQTATFPRHNSSNRITKCRPEMQNTLVNIIFVLLITLKLQDQVSLKDLCPGFVHQCKYTTTRINASQPWLHRLLHSPDCFIISALYMYTDLSSRRNFGV